MLIDLLKKYVRPYRKGVSIVLVLLLIQAIANLYLRTLNADLLNNGVAKGEVSYIWKIGAIMFGASTLIMVASMVLAYFSAIEATEF